MTYLLFSLSMLWFPVVPDYGTTDYCGLEAVICHVEDKEYLKRYIFQEFDKNGLDGQIGAKLAMCESSYDINAINHNTNGTTDYGLWQLNDRYYPIPENCDYKCQTQMAIEIVKKRGFKEWSCYDLIK